MNQSDQIARMYRRKNIKLWTNKSFQLKLVYNSSNTTPKIKLKLGYKVISHAGSSGFVYDFEIYTWKSKKNEDLGVGVSSTYVLRLAEGIPRNLNYKLLYDNWFCSVDLSWKLKEIGIMNVSTIRATRLKGCKIKMTKNYKKKEEEDLKKLEEKEKLISIASIFL